MSGYENVYAVYLYVYCISLQEKSFQLLCISKGCGFNKRLVNFKQSLLVDQNTFIALIAEHLICQKLIVRYLI